MRRKDAQPVGELVLQFLRSESLETPLNERRLLVAWHEVMGQVISSYTRELYIRNQILYVHLNSSVLRQELMMERQRIVMRLNDAVKAQVITDVVFR